MSKRTFAENSTPNRTSKRIKRKSTGVVKHESDEDETHTTDDEELKEDDHKFKIEIIEQARKPIIVGDLELEGLDKLESIPIQTHFKMKSSYKSVLILDIGSSFSKGYYLTLTTNKRKKNFTRLALEFSGQKIPTYAKTTLYYCPTMKEFSLHADDLVGASEVQSIKRLFTVFEAQEVEVAGTRLSVKTVMIQFLICLMRSISNFPKEDGEAEDQGVSQISKKVDCFILTVPTETPNHIKQHYKWCVFESIKICFKEFSHISYDDIYVIEEYVLLYHNDANDGDESVSLIVDIGHLTTDTTIVTNDRTITYANGEVGGVSIIHEAITKQGFDSFKVMEEIYKNPKKSTLPKGYSRLETVIKEACKEITTPLLDVILQHRPKKVFIYGAFVGSEYFKRIIKGLLNETELSLYIENHSFLLDEFRESHTFTVGFSSNGGSALVTGACNLVENAEDDEVLEFKRDIPAYVTYPTFIFADNEGNLKLQIGKVSYERVKNQDIEVFLVKFRNTIDMEKLMLEEIDENNFKQAGIMEFERFAVVNINFVDSEKIKTSFVLVGTVDGEYVGLSVYYQKLTCHYYVHRFHIPRKGRMERIPVNEIVKVFSMEDEEKTWYGTKYRVDLDIRGTNMNRIAKKEITELDKSDFKYFNLAQKPQDEDVSDDDTNNLKCIACKELLGSSTHVIGVGRLKRFRTAFNDSNIIPGNACSDCVNAFRRFYKI